MSNKSILQSNNNALSANNLDLQSLIDQANALPDAGVELPTLTNPAAAAEVFANKELIDADGNKIVGTFTIENELTAQDTLIAELQSVLDGKTSCGGASSGTIETCRVQLSYPGSFNLIYNRVKNGEVVCESLYLPFDMTPDMLTSLGHDLSSVVKGSFLICGKSALMNYNIISNISGDAEICSPHTSGTQAGNTCGVVYKINGDCTITITEK